MDKLKEIVDALIESINNALDALDRGNDNDWAREALERVSPTIDRYYAMSRVAHTPNISLREYIANAEVLEDCKTCPPELIDEAMDWILNGHNDLLDRLDGIVSEAVHHVMAAHHCPHCADSDCELSCEDNPCTGTAAEQSNCAFRS